jgi:hypothetical protein
MSTERKCQRCSNQIPWFIHKMAKYCPPCHKIVESEPRRCRDCQVILNDPTAPLYATRCQDCYDKSRHPVLTTKPPLYIKVCERCPNEIPEDLPNKICFSCMSQSVSSSGTSEDLFKVCDQCQKVLDLDHPSTLPTCYECMGRKACERICQDCEQLIEVDVPSKSVRCFACIGRYIARR